MGRLFGTDGVRGIANKELTCELAYKIGKAGAYVLTKGKKDAKILVGRDTRISGDMLEASLVAGICSVGVDVISLGIVPTPTVSYLARKYEADAGVVISASHNPVEYNGIKFFSGEGYKLPDEVEDEIEKHISNELSDIPLPTGDEIGVRHIKQDGIEDYIDFVKSIASTDFKGIKVAMDCAEGASYYSAPELFRRLGAEVHVIHNNPNGKNINKECGSTHLEQIKKFTVENKCDIGLAFDGDADRCLAVDENGEEINGDFLMTIIAKNLKDKGKLKNDTLVTTVMSNMGLDIACKREKINTIKTQVGDRYVLECMLDGGYKLGGEQSGHIILLDYNTTGDGLITAVEIVETLKESNKKLSELKSIMKNLPQILVNAKVTNDKKDIHLKDEEIVSEIKKLEDTLQGKGRVLIRASGTEPLVRVMLEGECIEEITNMAESLAKLIEKKAE
ncbi:phosphoglucosamine mutase GlmM [Gottschalkia acidurici 9a]|uniref:Phosphoglucosamine mutase n=1 Tax=Gottschalkia acidurici (strain ATCC 7906 / DSM 604 / BCRC 14475 / CIP 104303 / KCTC 5404 / NCIMB 10678 / 9a) TaxID=1128398 RepID=K0B0Z7_GOTA9|nr:phosphoglucosamine mutase [Gottschalkia acidurici]AFS79189.1 phosphoglucosamine mutase GlmM [Gottschalkia acidurici 9a]